jgi:phage shock protein E
MNLKEIVKTPSTKFVEVRTEQEFGMDHVKDAINIPLHILPDNLEKIKNTDAPAIVFYCRSGNRRGHAVSFLKQYGMQHVYNGGGIEDLNYLLN